MPLTLSERLRQIRQDAGITQQAMGAQGFISAPGWVKIENGSRQASEKLIDQIVLFLRQGGHIAAKAVDPLRQELLTLKYLGSNARFLRTLAVGYAGETESGRRLLAHNAPREKPRRGRPPARVPAGAR